MKPTIHSQWPVYLWRGVFLAGFGVKLLSWTHLPPLMSPSTITMIEVAGWAFVGLSLLAFLVPGLIAGWVINRIFGRPKPEPVAAPMQTVYIVPANVIPINQAAQTAPAPVAQKAQASGGNSGHASKPSSGNGLPSLDDIETQVELSLDGLVGFDELAKAFASEVHDYWSRPAESRALLFWGSAGTGKTEFAQRLAGQRGAHKIPGLDFPGFEVRYFTGVDGRLGVKEIVDSAQGRGIVFVDEADKLFDPSAEMVGAAEAKQFRQSIINYFGKAPLLWVFLGTFHEMRQGGNLTEKMLSNTLGAELATRIDFGWKFPEWTIASVLQAMKTHPGRRTPYDDGAAALLAQHAVECQGGIRAYEKADRHFFKLWQKGGSKPDFTVTAAMAMDYLKGLNQAA